MSQQYIQMFQDFRSILCVCPCCGDIVRVSDLHLQYRDEAPKTWLDDYDTQLREFAKLVEEFGEQEARIRAEAIARGRLKVIESANTCIDPRISCLSYDPYDIKALFSPIDFVVFNGMNHDENLNDIVFLGEKKEDQVRDSLRDTIEAENYDFKIARVSDEGNVTFE